jgi:hypothetical protein
MTETPRYANRMLEAVHEGAIDLFAGGSISAAEMRRFDDLCLRAPEVSESAGAKINTRRSP